MSDALMEELRVRFRDGARTRIATMRSLLDAIDADAESSDAIRELMRHFHFFAGMGTTCGFPIISAVADEGEGALTELLRSGAARGDGDAAAWRALVARIEQEL